MVKCMKTLTSGLNGAAPDGLPGWSAPDASDGWQQQVICLSSTVSSVLALEIFSVLCSYST